MFESRDRDPLFTHPWTSALKVLLYSVVFCAAVLGNALVLGAVTANPSMHSSVNLLILNMSVADLLLVLVTMFPNLLTELFFGALHVPFYCTISATSPSKAHCPLQSRTARSLGSRPPARPLGCPAPSWPGPWARARRPGA